MLNNERNKQKRARSWRQRENVKRNWLKGTCKETKRGEYTLDFQDMELSVYCKKDTLVMDPGLTRLNNFCRILTMVCWYWTNCTFGLYPSSGVSKNWGI